MKKTTYSETASEHAERAYTLILTGVMDCQSAEDQLLLLQSLVCQCAVFTRMLSGDEAFLALLEKIRHADIEVADAVLPRQIHGQAFAAVFTPQTDTVGLRRGRISNAIHIKCSIMRLFEAI